MLRIKLFAVLLIIFYGCGEKSPETPAGRNEKLMFSSTAYYNHLRAAFVPDTNRVFQNSIQYRDTLYYYYLANKFNPVFIKSFEEEGTIFALLEILKAAERHGLDPEWYHTSLIEKEFISAVTGDSVYPARYEHLANTEVLVADALIKYAWHLRYGVVNPKEIYPDSYYLPLPDSTSKDLFEPLKQKDIIGYLKKIQPQNKRYTDLQAALKYYKQFEKLEFVPIQIPSAKIEPGNLSPFIYPIRQRLITLKFIDSAAARSDSLNLYDSTMIEPVKSFQRLNGLDDDGVIGKATVEKLNTLPEEYIRKIKMNLERFRWNNYSDSSKYVLINIPDFRLYVIEKGEELFNIKVCAGKRRSANFRTQMDQYLKTKKSYLKPEDWETPNMTGEISYLILNPTWTVPNSIIKEEIAREVRKDSSYLLRKNFKVYKDNISVDPASVPSSEFLRNNTEYRVVQDAGPWNALGKIKFMFNNPFGIYLHDTPTRAPFGKANRAVSHGCVRVEKPLQLAEYILKDNSKWNVDYLKLEIGQQVEDNSVREEYYRIRNSLRANASYGKTTEVRLNKKIRIIVDYFTAWVDKEGKVNFRDDVYRRDDLLAEKLFPANKLKDVTALK